MVDAPLLTLPAGIVRGMRRDGVRHFLSIPYAAPPVGDRRFAPPAEPEPWSGERDGTQAGPNAPQRTGQVPGLATEPLIGKGWSRGDDYLTLNIWAPDTSATTLPVMVFIHGGGFVVGSKDAPVQNGATFARDGVICVAINYRLGIDGFLPIDGVPTNLGLRDMVAALQWVQDNIDAAGGDPGNVTVFGESAGAMAIADLMTSPLAKGLFRRAIVQSGHGAMTRDIGIARRVTTKLARLLHITPDAKGFAGVDPQTAFDAIEKLSKPAARLDLRDRAGHEPVFGISRFIPVHGDDVLPVPPPEALKAGAGADVDLLIGSNAEEMNLYLVPTGVRAKVNRLLAWFVLRKSHPRAWATLKAYGMGKAHAGTVLNRALNDLVFRWPARRFAEEHRGRTHVYEFEWRSTAFGGELGAAHAMELPFVFDTLHTATGAEGLCGPSAPQELADRIHALWVGFARDGSLPWPEFTREDRQVYRLAAAKAAHEPPMPAASFLP